MARFFWNDAAWLRRTNAAIDRMPPDIRAAIWTATREELDRTHFAECAATLPDGLQRAAANLYVREAGRNGKRAANLAAAELRDTFTGAGIDLAATDDEIRELAEQRAAAVGRIIGARPMTEEEARARIDAYCKRHHVEPPNRKKVKTLQGLVARATCPRWWRRAIRRGVVREIERLAVQLGFVHRRASIYASAEAVARRRSQKRRNARALEQTLIGELLSEEDAAAGAVPAVLTLAEAAKGNISNPTIRRVEMMTRSRGFEDYAEARGHVGLFVTWTCPSRMHARYAESGEPVPHYDRTTPKQAQQYLCKQWQKARSALARRQIFPYGFRVAEPHHDGTPHWHMLMFVDRSCVDATIKLLARYACEVDARELEHDRARQARFHWKQMDPKEGGATAYIAAYIGKNIDGHKVGRDFEAGDDRDAAETVSNVEAWASTWGIRQFQQIGGPPVGIWRELRRLRESPQLPLFDEFHAAADMGHWARFFGLMGGVGMYRRDRPLQPWKIEAARLSQYDQEPMPRLEGVTRLLEYCRTRFVEWEIHRIHAREGAMTATSFEGSTRASSPGQPCGEVRRSPAESLPATLPPTGDRGFQFLQQEGVKGGAPPPAPPPWTRGNNCTLH